MLYKGYKMYKYQVWVRINPLQTIHTIVYASNDFDAKMIAETQFGQGNVLNYTRIDE